jgi:hypothetical protein
LKDPPVTIELIEGDVAIGLILPMLTHISPSPFGRNSPRPKLPVDKVLCGHYTRVRLIAVAASTCLSHVHSIVSPF